MTGALLLGAVNSPHTQQLAAMVTEEVGGVVVAGWVSPDLPAAEPARGVAVEVIPKVALSRVGAPFHLAWQARLLRRLKPAVVHAHGANEFAAMAVLARGVPLIGTGRATPARPGSSRIGAGRRGATPLIVTAYGSDVLLAEGTARDRAARALRGADAVTGDSPQLLDAAVALGADRARAHLIGWGVDLARFAPPEGGRAAARRRLGLPEDGALVLSPRPLRDLYNPALVVAAFDHVADDNPGVRLLLKHLGAGDPPPPSRHPDRVHVLGHVLAASLPDVYGAADVCVSVPGSDSAPRTVWETMACGTPCVVSDLPWLDGMLERGEEVLPVARAAAPIADAISGLLADPGRAARIAARARERVERDHDENDHRRRWLELRNLTTE